jgi:hypothetical protein
MKDHEINQAIAESLGWRLCEKQVEGMNNVYWLPPGQEDYPEAVFIFCDTIPAEYCNDLNAMHEVEKTLFRTGYTDTLNQNYWNTVWNVCGDLYRKTTTVAHATALQRAEAYLRTIGKWRES